ncbi:MAG: isoprenylcysteine carboxylmethyltransferase family protein [Pseudomonadota bacterium]
MNNGPAERPSRFPWPPALMVLFAALAWLGSPANQPDTWQLWLGAGLAIAGLTLDALGAAHLLRHKTAVLPHRAASTLVSSGVFGISRNPIYVGYVAILVGIAILRPGLISALCVCTFAILLLKLAIEPEEAHLSAKFGTDWQDYAERVPRWFGPL